MKFYMLSLVSAVLFVQSAQARPKYGMAGCGLGAIVANELNWGDNGLQLLAATSNGVYGNQTFAISSGTSFCGAPVSGHAKEAKGEEEAERKVFLRYNLAQIKADAARGDGEYIAGLADLFDCRDQLTGSFSEFADMSQSQHQDLFNSDDPEVVYANYVKTMTASGLACS